MRKNTLILFFILCTIQSFSQTTSKNNTYLKISGGRVAFGTGDFLGYSFAFEASRNIVQKPTWGLAKLLIGGEMIFENGVKNPIVQMPPYEIYLSKWFYHTSNTVLWAKASYYPFKKIVKGFNIQFGPTAGYSYRSTEARIEFESGATGTVRQSNLAFDNGFTMGYRISTGIEFDITKKLQTGFRLDFSNNNKGEINTLAGLKLGVAL
jgi:hypothetical protein